MSMENLVVIENLNHYYQEAKQQKQVLFEINLTIQSGKNTYPNGRIWLGKNYINLLDWLFAFRSGRKFENFRSTVIWD